MSARPRGGRRARAAWLSLALVAAPALVACGGKPPEAPARDPSAPQWQDALEGTEDIVLVVRPEAMKRDPVYGPAFDALARLAAARSGSGVRTIEAIGSAEEIVCGVEPDGGAILVARRVRADLDPEKLADETGARLFRFGAQIRQVRELVSDRADASLFVLPERTWVVALGPARARARQAYATPFGRPTPTYEAGALALARFDGAALVKAVPRLSQGSFAPLVAHLGHVTVALAGGTGGLVATFRYEDDGAAALAELRARDLVTRLAAQGGERYVWLKGATVSRDTVGPATVRVAVSVPPPVIAELKRATSADMSTFAQ